MREGFILVCGYTFLYGARSLKFKSHPDQIGSIADGSRPLRYFFFFWKLSVLHMLNDVDIVPQTRFTIRHISPSMIKI